jgi:glucosamine-6-phosphate deaminase
VEASGARADVTPLTVFPTPEALGDALATQIVDRATAAARDGKRFLLGCPTGRTPRPLYAALARRELDWRHVTLVMMDEYLVANAWATEYWSCHAFVRRHVTFDVGEIWFPDPADPSAYDQQIADAGGIDFFVLASGAGDGHVAFNSPGSPRDSRTRVIVLPEQTRRDNLLTSPSFGSLENVPRHGVSVGIATIAAAREAVLVLTGASKRLSLSRVISADRYEPSWPATVIHEIPRRAILADAEAAAAEGV